MIKRLIIKNFRNYDFVQFQIHDRYIMVCGPNGSGKTNLLEALSFFEYGRGLRSCAFEDVVSNHGGFDRFTLFIELHDGQTISIDAQAQKKQIRINGKNVSGYGDIHKKIRMLWINPSNDRIFSDTPEKRRKFLNALCVILEPNYSDIWKKYEHCIQERSHILKYGHDAQWLDILEEKIVQYGVQIQHYRKMVLERINSVTFEFFPHFIYEVVGAFDEAELRQKIFLSREKDRIVGGCGVGPHKSDLSGYLSDQPLKLCSNGQQCMAVIGIYLSLLKFMEVPTILLIDEVLSHLDPENYALLFKELDNFPDLQLWFTSIAPDHL